jgi:hypothetical protein
MVVFTVELGLCMVVLFTLDVAGFVRLADIPDRYVVIGIWGLVVLAIGILGLPILLPSDRKR